MPRIHFTSSMRNCRALVSGMLLLAVMFPAATASALPPSATRLEGDQFVDPGAAMEQFSALEEGEMETMRGGLRVAGLDVSFGVNLRTTGTGFVREAVYNLNAAGGFDQVSNNLTSDAGIAAPVHLVGGTAGATLSDLLPGVNLAGLSDSTGGLVIGNSSGFTAVLEKLTQNSIISALVTNSNDQNLSNEIDVDITIKNFTEYVDAARNSVFANTLGRSVRAATAPR